MSRVLVADDSIFMRKVISSIIEKAEGLELVGTARSGRDCVMQAMALKPDLIALDLEMPEMNGLAVLREILRLNQDPRPGVVMCSHLTKDGSLEALAALRMGAADFVTKEMDSCQRNPARFGEELVAKLRAVGAPRANGESGSPIHERSLSEGVVGSIVEQEISVVVIGANTGGPPMVESLVCSLEPGWQVPILIAQHMPGLFSRCFAERLGAMANVEVMIAEDGDRVQPGVVYIGEGGSHLRVVSVGGEMRLKVSGEPSGDVFKPSVNELCESAAQSYGQHALGMLLTGMGDDGTAGAGSLRAAGAAVVAQERTTCVVHEMPGNVIRAGLANAVGNAEQMKVLLAAVGRRAKARARLAASSSGRNLA